jgi:ankyrin repeat protein
VLGAVDRHGLSALQWAAGGGHLAAVEVLLQCMDRHSDTTSANGGVPAAAGMTDVDRPSKDGRTALMWACRNGHIDVAQRLVTAGADPERRSKKGVGCLHWAVWGRCQQMAAWLLAPPLSLDLQAESCAGCNCAVWAAASGGLEIAQWLHQQGADFAKLNHWGHGVVNKAAWRGHRELLGWMLDTLPEVREQLWLQDYAGLVPIELARQAGHMETVAALAAHMGRQPERQYRRAISSPDVHQHKLRELGLTDPHAL